LDERVSNLEYRVEMLQDRVIILDGKGVEAVALLRMIERRDQRIKVLEDRTKQ
jgi:hypothetical protein